MTLIHALIAGADCIDDADLLCSRSTAAVLGHRVPPPSTLAPGPGDRPLIIDVDSTTCGVPGPAKQGSA
jgi:hypothetical protein